MQPRRPPAGGLGPPPAPDSPSEDAIAAKFVSAYESADLDALVALLTGDVFISMPPMPFEYEGRDVVARFFASIFGSGRRFDLVPTRANGQPAFGAYLRAPPPVAVAFEYRRGAAAAEVVHLDHQVDAVLGRQAGNRGRSDVLDADRAGQQLAQLRGQPRTLTSPGRAPQPPEVMALAGRYGLQFGQPDWLPELIGRYHLTPPPGG